MRERKRKQFQKNFKTGLFFGRVTTSIVFISLLLLVGVFYLSQQNMVTVKGEEITNLEIKKSELESERNRLQLEATRLQSIQELEGRIKEDPSSQERFVPIERINYIPSSNIVTR